MARRRKNFNFLKKITSPFKLTKKKREKLLTLGLVAVMIFAFWVYQTSKTRPARKHAVKKKFSVSRKSAPLPNPAERPQPSTHAEPIVYYKPNPVTHLPMIPAPAPFRRFSGSPKIVFVIDDIGNTGSYVSEIEKLGSDVTYSILPLLPHTAFYDQLSLKTGAEVILHLPLESYKGTIPGPGLITSSMPDDYVMEELNRNLASVPHRIGANNHMGSKGTSDPRLMDLILSELKKDNLLFLDSRTTSQSVAPLVAKELGVAILRRDEFLDNDDNIPAIQAEVKKLSEDARRKGYAIGIGHYRLNTLRVLQEAIPQLKRDGFEIISLRELSAYKKSARS